MLQPSNLPLNEFVGGPDDQGAQQIEGRVHEGSDERKGGGGEGGDDFGDEEDNVCYYVDLEMVSRNAHRILKAEGLYVDSPLGPLLAGPAPLPLIVRQQRINIPLGIF